MTRKSVLIFFDLLKENKVEEALYIINYSGDFILEKVEKIIKVLNQTRFIGNENLDIQIKIKKGILTKEEVNDYYEQNKTFCHKGDFDLIYALFLEKWGIDLIEFDIDWFKYIFLLEDILLGDNSLTKRISYRNFKPQKGKGMEEFNASGLALKSKYAYFSEREEE